MALSEIPNLPNLGEQNLSIPATACTHVTPFGCAGSNVHVKLIYICLRVINANTKNTSLFDTLRTVLHVHTQHRIQNKHTVQARSKHTACPHSMPPRSPSASPEPESAVLSSDAASDSDPDYHTSASSAGDSSSDEASGTSATESDAEAESEAAESEAAESEAAESSAAESEAAESEAAEASASDTECAEPVPKRARVRRA